MKPLSFVVKLCLLAQMVRVDFDNKERQQYLDKLFTDPDNAKKKQTDTNPRNKHSK
jgi:hypothetical protein